MVEPDLRAYDRLNGNEELYAELSRINNELVNLRRQLEKKNAALERANSQLEIEIAERKRAEEEARFLARHDPLVNIYNRRHLFHLGRVEIGRARKLQRPLSLILFDVDHFKQVNDCYGHAWGDALLVEVSKRCGQALRGVDIFGRYGGEEFVILLPETDLPAAMKVAERLRKVVAATGLETEQGRLGVTASFGVAALCPENYEDSLEALLRQADLALYHAKHQGRNQIAAGQAQLSAA